jgi:pimeloyl-ACP methyl ester carboxylesterase
MRSLLRSTGPFAVAAALLLSQISSAAHANPTPSSPAVGQSKVTWHRCPTQDDEPAGAQCGSVRVRLDWNRPGGRTLDIAIVRRRATEPAHRIGTLMYLPGGPGESGVDTLSGTNTFGGAEKRFDLVSFDPRGVGRSQPVRCRTSAVMTTIVSTSEPIRSRARFNGVQALDAKLAASCTQHPAGILGHLDATSVAQDMEAIRIALDTPTLTLYGHSYGTFYGQAYANLHSDHVRAAVLDGVLDHTADVHRLMVESARSLEQSFAQFVRWCNDERSCSLHNRRPWKVYDKLATKARKGTLRNAADPKHRISLAEFNATIDGMLFTPSWTVTGTYLDDLDRGIAFETDQGEQPQLPALVPFPDPAMCADFNLGARDYQTYAEARRAARQAAPHFRYSPNTTSMVNLCLGFPIRTVNPGAPLRARTSTPMLLINSRYDNATPIDWARAVDREPGVSANLVEVNGSGHGLKIFNGGASHDAVFNYLTHLVVPDSGTIVPDSPHT